MSDAEKPRRIRDPVHGLIVFCEDKSDFQNETDRIAWSLLNTFEFQRLRRIRQLGFSDLVYPGATHSRFAHSIGVYHTARKLIAVIHRRQGCLDERRAREVLLAALLHDIGHGPFSHSFEEIAKALGRKKRHEAWSAEIVEGDTEVNLKLHNADRTLPESIGKVLRATEPEDIYATVVSSQFDADRPCTKSTTSIASQRSKRFWSRKDRQTKSRLTSPACRIWSTRLAMRNRFVVSMLLIRIPSTNFETLQED